MPGGADLPYCKKLNGKGNTQIKAYVEAGGTYIGFCAGAYYGSHYCEFHKGDTRGYEVLGERELSFFPGSAVGPVLAPYDYQSNSGSRIAQIKWQQSDAQENQIYNVYFNGGCYFKDADQYENVRVLATYNNKGFEGRAAIVECRVGQGKALLSGVHPECSFDDLEGNDQNLSAEDQNHLKTRIAPYLADASHKKLFALLMNAIQ
jgi:biotin--protein ligase